MFLAYLIIGISAWFLAAIIVGWRTLCDPRRLVGWYFLLYFITYFVRAFPESVHKNSNIYEMLMITGFDAVPGSMTIAVSSSILFLALGYRLGGYRRQSRMGTNSLERVHHRKALTFVAWGLIFWGYVSILLVSNTAAVENVEGRGFAINVGSTAWITDAILLVSSGALALYLLNRRLGFSLLITAPWFIVRVSSGWGRIILIGHIFALMAAFMIRESFTWTARKISQALMIGVLIFLTVTIFFPSVKMYRAQGGTIFDLSRQDLGNIFTQNFKLENFDQTTGDLAGFETTAYMLEVKQPPTWGTYYVYSFLIKPIPRMLWKGKPLPPDLAKWWFDIDEDTRFFGLAPGSIGGAFQAWGWLGLPLEFILTGWIFRRMELKVLDRAAPIYWLMAYAGFFGILPQLGRDTLLQMLADRWLFVYGIPVVLFWWVERSKPLGQLIEQLETRSTGKSPGRTGLGRA